MESAGGPGSHPALRPVPHRATFTNCYSRIESLNLRTTSSSRPIPLALPTEIQDPSTEGRLILMSTPRDYLDITLDNEWTTGASLLPDVGAGGPGTYESTFALSALAADHPVGSRRRPGVSTWPAGKQLLMRDILLLRLLELDEHRDEAGATRDSLATYLRVARPRICAIAGDLEAEGLVRTMRKRPGGHGRMKKVSTLSERGKEVATAARGWLLGEMVDIDGIVGSVEYHLSRLANGRSVTTLLRRSKFLGERSGDEHAED